jgi:hypothetical protein
VRLRRRDKEQPLRYYLYISDTKLDMLFEQIDESILKRISAEVKVDLKLASVTLRQTDQPAPARTAKLRVVERFITQHHHVGTIQEPGPEYFRGQMDMQWGWLAGYAADEPTRPIVVFRGRESSQFVALAGSRRHVLGERVPDTGQNAEAWSGLPNILAVVGEHISRSPEIAELQRAMRAGPVVSEDSAALFDPPEAAWSAFAVTHLNTPPQPLEFLAVPLLEGLMSEEGIHGVEGFAGVHAVLGTPLYVARWNHP